MPIVSREQIAQSWGRHPARRLPFSKLIAGLRQRVEEGLVYEREDGPLRLFNYLARTQNDGRWDIFTLMARGLVLDVERQRVLATPFPKFFNYGEAQVWGADRVEGEVSVTDKLDGSLGIVFHDGGTWRAVTRGAFDSAQARWTLRWLHRNVDLSRLVPGVTYLFEVVYPDNRVVVRYPFQGLVLLGAYDGEGYELARDQLETLATSLDLRLARLDVFRSVDALVEAAETLDGDSEGWVIRFPNGHRLKVKGAEYCRLHRLISNVSPIAVWELMRQGDDLDAIRLELPEELRVDFDAIRSLLSIQLQVMLDEVAWSHQTTRDLDDRSVGLAFRDGAWADGRVVTDVERTFLFPARKRAFLEKVHVIGDPMRRLAFRSIRPRGQSLQGYSPSTAEDRFQGTPARQGSAPPPLGSTARVAGHST